MSDKQDGVWCCVNHVPRGAEIISVRLCGPCECRWCGRVVGGGVQVGGEWADDREVSQFVAADIAWGEM